MAKKDFSQVNSNPDYISSRRAQALAAEPAPQAEQAAAVPEGMRLVPETKSRRLQLLIRPTLYNHVKAKAEAAGQSVNEYINHVLTDAVKEV